MEERGRRREGRALDEGGRWGGDGRMLGMEVGWKEGEGEERGMGVRAGCKEGKKRG